MSKHQLGSSAWKGIWKSTPVAMQLLAHMSYHWDDTTQCLQFSSVGVPCPWVSNTLGLTSQLRLYLKHYASCQPVMRSLCRILCWFLLSSITGFSLLLWCQFKTLVLAFYIPAKHTMWVLLSSTDNYKKRQASLGCCYNLSNTASEPRKSLSYMASLWWAAM